MTEIQNRLRLVTPGLLLALCAILFSWGLGGVFGAAESSLRGKLEADAAAVLDTAYAGDQGAADTVTAKSWSYLKRAHLHAGVLGATSAMLILLMVLLATPTWKEQTAAVLLGGGALGYGLFWLLAGFLAPGMGGTGAAKDALEWLAVPTAGSLLLGLTFVIATLVMARLRK